MPEINLEFLLGAMPAAEAALYRVLIQLIPAPSPEAPNRCGRQIEMALLAKLTGYTKRWVIELMQRLEKNSFIRTDGGSGAVKWIWLLPPGVLRLGKSYPTKLARRKKTSPGKAKAPRAAASRPKHRRKETVPSPKPGAEVNVAPPVERPAAIPERRRKGPIPPAGPAPDDPALLATALIPPPPAPASPMLPAAMMPPPPPATPPGGPAPGNSVVAATTVTPAPSRARGGTAVRNPRSRATKIAPPSSTAPGDLAAGEPVVPAPMVPPVPSAAPGAPAPANPMRGAKAARPPTASTGAASSDPVVPATRVTPAPPTAPGGLTAGIRVVRRAAKIAPPPAPGHPVVPAARVPPASSAALGIPASGNPVRPAARVTPPPPEPAAPAVPAAKRVSPRKSTKKLPAGHSHWESAPIEEMVAYSCSLPVTPELIGHLKTHGMTDRKSVV